MLEYMLETFSYLPVAGNLLRADMKNYIDGQLSYCDDRQFSSQFPYKETGVAQCFFQQKIIHGDGGEYLTGSKYLGGDLRKPFVDLVVSSAPLTKRAVTSILTAWMPMGASSIRLLRPHAANGCGNIDQYFYLGVSSRGTENPKYTGAGVHLQLADLSLQHWCFQALQQSCTGTYLKILYLTDRVYLLNENEIHDAITEESVFIILSDNSRAGFIICKPGRRAFVSDYWITEEIVIPGFRGKRLASAAQHALSSVLSQTHSPLVLCGAIVTGNAPSIRTAELTGRMRVMEYVFLKEGDINA